MTVVLDSSAVLALLWEEAGYEQVEAMLEQARISSVNAAEVVSKLVDRGFEPEEAGNIILGLAIEITDFDTEMAILCGQLKKNTKHLGLSLGDRACIALGQACMGEIITADKIWARLETNVPIRVIR